MNKDLEFSQKLIKTSHKKYSDKTQLGVSYVECACCGYRANDLVRHIKKYHTIISVDDYKKTYGEIRSKNFADKLKSGALSPFSKGFVKYDGIENKEEIANKKRQAAYDNSLAKPEKRNSTLEFYLHKGHSLEEATRLLSERQSTFSLKKCIAKYGDVLGHIKFKERQDKWQSTLNDKSDEEKAEINLKKSITSHIDCKFFYILLLENGYVKIGITRYDINRRYKLASRKFVKETIIFEENSPEVSFYIEQLLKSKFKQFKILKEEQIGAFGHTETFTLNVDDVVAEYHRLKSIDFEDLKDMFNDLIMDYEKWN